MTFSFTDRPAKLQPKHILGGERGAKVYAVGRHTVTVYDDGEVTCQQDRYEGDPRRTLPNLEIIDGQIRIAMEDLIDEILARIEPEELAVSLWANDEVKDRFMDALSERFSQGNVGDADRRKFLDKVKEQVHDKALDGLTAAMAKMEYTISTGWSCWREVDACNEWLAYNDIRDADGNPYRLKNPSFNDQFKIGGPTWNEARDHWRHEIRQQLGWGATS